MAIDAVLRSLEMSLQRRMMRRKWNNYELVEHWILDDEDKRLICQKRGANRLGFALLLKFFQLKGRFPEKKSEIPRVVRTFVAEQLDIDEDLYQHYNWQGRALKYHRVEIRQLYGFHRMRRSEFTPLRQWLIAEVLPQVVEPRHMQELLYQELRTRKIEPPTYTQVERLLSSAQRQFEIQLCESIVQQLPRPCRQALDKLTGSQSDSYLLEPDEISLNQLKQEAGGVSLNILTAELSKLEIIQNLVLPAGLFDNLCESIVERYRLRVATETLTELRRHPTAIRYTLLSAFCWLRSQEIIDNVVELFILLVHRLESRSRKRAAAEVVANTEVKDDHDKLLYQIALAALAEPDGLVKAVIYPVANEERLEHLIDTLGDGTTFRDRLHERLKRAYTHYYRRLLPLILKALEFRSDSTALQPLMRALDLLKIYADKPRQDPYAADVEVPMDGVLSTEWQAAAMTTDAKGEPQIDRATYELGVLRTVREEASLQRAVGGWSQTLSQPR